MWHEGLLCSAVIVTNENEVVEVQSCLYATHSAAWDCRWSWLPQQIAHTPVWLATSIRMARHDKTAFPALKHHGLPLTAGPSIYNDDSIHPSADAYERCC